MKRILVVGDIIADVYHECIFKKMCPDATDIKAIARTGVSTMLPGGAANVAINISVLSPGTEVDLIGLLDFDMLAAVKNASNVNTGWCHRTSSNKSIITKERFIVDGKSVLRVDTEAADFSILENLKIYLSGSAGELDLIVLSDYFCGTVTDEVIKVLLEFKEKLIIDTKRTDLSVFDGSLLIKLNQQEWQNVLQTESIPERFFKYMCVTHGHLGASIKERKLRSGKNWTQSFTISAKKAEVVDVCGCGDTFLAGLAVSLSDDANDVFSALQFANAAASTVVSKSRTAAADRELTIKLLGGI